MNLDVQPRLCVFALLYCLTYSATAQNFPTGGTPRGQKLIARRESNLELLTRSLNYADLSYACPPFTDFGAPKAPYILSADIIPYFAVGGKWSPVALHLTPRFKARIFRDNALRGDSSLPVRTPSYMPGVTLYFKWDKLNSSSARFYKFASLAAFHHSNGQDGNSLRPDGTYNQYNGSFSTNYLEAAVYASRKFGYLPKKSEDFPCSNDTRNHYDAYGKLGFEKHFATDKNLIGRYGQNRLNVKTGVIRNKGYRDRIITQPTDTIYSECYTREQYRLVFNASFITDARLSDLENKMNSWKRRVNAEVMIARRLPVSANIAMQASIGYYGSDPYNAYFEDRYFFARVGLALGFFTATDYKDNSSQNR